MKQLQYLNILAKKEYIGLKPGLMRIKKVLKSLGNPENIFPIIHIAGTNGKGSVAAMLNSILIAAGYKVGFYSSPHLINYRERIRINNKLIANKNFNKWLGLVLKAPAAHKLTYFEIITALAFAYFAAEKVDVVVCEVGLGGRFDATNVAKNVLVSCITSIDFDHKEYLGNTLSTIAFEKAGIIKNNVPVVVYTGHIVADNVIKQVAARKKAQMYFLDKNFFYKSLFVDWHKLQQVFSYYGTENVYQNLWFNLLGEHQVRNAALAIACLEIINKTFKVSENAVRKGLIQVTWPGRFQIETWKINNKKVDIIIDGAHNVAGAKVFKSTLLNSPYAKHKLTLVMCVLRDKEYEKIIAVLNELVKKVLIFSPESLRGLPLQNLRKEWEKYLAKNKIVELENFSEFSDYLTTKDKLVAISGSLYAVSEALKYARNNQQLV